MVIQVRIGGGLGGQALFEFGVVGVDFGSAIVLIEIQFCDFVFLLRYLFINLPFFDSISWL